MPVYRGRKPGTWRVVVWKGNRPHEQTVRGTKRDAETHEAKFRLELDVRDPVAARAVPTFASFCVDTYKPHAKAHLKPSTWAKVRRYQVETLCEHFGPMRLTQIDAAAVEAWKRARAAEVGPTTVNNELRLLGTILRYAASIGVPCALPKVKRLRKRGDGRVVAYTPEQVQALYAATAKRAPAMLPMIVWLANTGCRKGEALAAEWSWIDLPARLIRIPATAAWQPKNGRAREVPISDALLPYLTGERRHERWIHPNRRGRRFVDFPKDLWWEITAEAGVDGGPHRLRHTFASLFLQAQPDLFLLAQVLGHSHTRVTELYSHLLPGHLARARNAVSLAPATETMARTMGDDDETARKQGSS